MLNRTASKSYLYAVYMEYGEEALEEKARQLGVDDERRDDILLEVEIAADELFETTDGKEYARALEEKKKGAAILLVSADLEELMSLSDRMLILCGGKCSGEVTDVAAAAEEEIGLLMGGITHSREGGESA